MKTFVTDEPVRIRYVADDEPYDDSWCEGEELAALHELIERDGVWGAVAEYRCPCCTQWVETDSIWGLIGPDAHDYIPDLLESARSALETHLQEN